MLAVEVIRRKRDGHALATAEIEAFVQGLVDGSWSEGQVAALAMAILLRGMQRDEVVTLTRAMLHSGEVLRWHDAGLPGPVLDKHSTGGVGDKVSLMLAPIVAACGGVVPMVSGRGLGHTGGTLDKLAALPGYTIEPPREQLLRVLRHCGCAIIGASARIAPADRRLYAVRDVTATVESVPLITASILSKKLAAGLQTLVLDVKVGNGAFAATLDEARALATSLVQVASAAGLPTEALLTDMNQVLGRSAGNALELQEALDFLAGTEREPRLLEVTLALAARMLRLAGLAPDLAAARQRAEAALSSGRAAEHFARMVAGLGGPADVFAPGRTLPAAPVQRELPAARSGVLQAMDTRALGLAVVALGGGRRQAADALDLRVGLSHLLPLGRAVQAGEPLLRVHAASAAAADEALHAAARALVIGEAPVAEAPVVLEAITASA
ncbi:MAG: thymidine phosphorylase [Burkholderiales bacterium]|nr:thymidine phosphorylase [Burkholderiales bacterium]